ncbi:hypothetical protein CCAN2_970004 [Capnocytophaga canimorsus]|nr:hypothetical protein [Capnocytophaga canimorsus]CEN51758.1 hypothetical protein CCAN2_970004 [Capnocytophaga canimorsus]
MYLTITLVDFWEKLKNIMSIVIFNIKGNNFTLLTLIYITLSSFILVFLSKKLSHFLEHKLLARRISQQGVRAAIVTITRYFLLVFGFFYF